MIHYQVTRQERQAIHGRPFMARAMLCDTGDGNATGVNPADWSGLSPAVTCAACLDRLHLIAPRERALIAESNAKGLRLATLSYKKGVE